MERETGMLVTKCFTFSCAHRLIVRDLSPKENKDIFGKCAGLHGHNYRLEVTVGGPVDPKTGMVIDFGELGDRVRKAVLEKLDHHDLNRVAGLESRVPTAENLLLLIKEWLEDDGLQLRRLKLWETGTCLVELVVRGDCA